MPSSSRFPSFARQWAVPIILLTSTALATFWALYVIDNAVAVANAPPGSSSYTAIGRFLRFDPGSLTDALSGLAAVLTAAFGIVITVVSIIVQLSADRYTGVARLFLHDRVNQAVMAFYVVGCVTAIWLSVSLQSAFAPRVTLFAQLLVTTAGLVLMAPYFGYVFWFVDPTNIVTRLRRQAGVTAASGATATGTDAVLTSQAATVGALEELTDITNNSISGKDKIIASAAIDALRDFALDYLPLKRAGTTEWFRISDSIRRNPDFESMDGESLRDLETRQTWVEWKVMRQFLGIFNDALPTMRDVNYLIAIDTRYIGEAAVRADDHELVALVFRYMNSYLRATLNARDVRTAYNVLNQYRLLVESVLRACEGPTAVQAVRHMIYYGHVGFEMQLGFVTETVAYDVAAICETANEIGAAEEAQMVRMFLDLDQPVRTRGAESAFLGVRKAQVKLAAYYITSGAHDRAHLISQDMRDEPRERLVRIRYALENATTKDFWEISDRGRDFEYMPPDRRAALATFFEWLDVAAPKADHVVSAQARSTPLSVSALIPDGAKRS